MEARYEQAAKAAWIGIIGNVALVLMKGIIGLVSGSKALIADAANSASDVAGSFVVLKGIRTAHLPPDMDHPYGHGKAETITAIVIAVILMLIGLEIAISAIKAMNAGIQEAPHWHALAAIIVAIVAKEALFQIKYRLGKKLSAHALITNAWVDRSHIFSSFIALVGVGAAIIGSYWGISWLYYMDPIASVFIACLVIMSGYKLVMRTIHSKPELVLYEENCEQLLKDVLTTNGVITVDELRAREHGHYIVVDVKISVNPRITVSEGHDIAKAVKFNLMEKFTHVSDVYVHVNPYDPGYPYKVQIESDESSMPTMLH